jgi:hypothetical protein
MHSALPGESPCARLQSSTCFRCAARQCFTTFRALAVEIDVCSDHYCPFIAAQSLVRRRIAVPLLLGQLYVTDFFLAYRTPAHARFAAKAVKLDYCSERMQHL